MTSKDHPPYPFPTIREVVCEVHFQIGRSWAASFYSEYLKKIEDQFPTFEPVAIAAPVIIRVEQSAGDASGWLQPQVIRYKHTSRNLLLQLSEKRLVVNVLPAYPGWQQVREDIDYSWNKLCEVVHPIGIERIGLRYINSIARGDKDETLGRWLKSSDYVPPIILPARRGFSTQILHPLTEEDRILVRVGEQANPTNDFGAFIFDIDRITEKHIAADANSLLENATRLHDEVWRVFSSAKTDDLERLLQGKFV